MSENNKTEAVKSDSTTEIVGVNFREAGKIYYFAFISLEHGTPEEKAHVPRASPRREETVCAKAPHQRYRNAEC